MNVYILGCMYTHRHTHAPRWSPQAPHRPVCTELYTLNPFPCPSCGLRRVASQWLRARGGSSFRSCGHSGCFCFLLLKVHCSDHLGRSVSVLWLLPPVPFLKWDVRSGGGGWLSPGNLLNAARFRENPQFTSLCSVASSLTPSNHLFFVNFIGENTLVTFSI